MNSAPRSLDPPKARLDRKVWVNTMTTANVSLSQAREWSVNLTSATLIAAAIKAENYKNKPYCTALDNALRQLEDGRTWTLRGEALTVQSASRHWVEHNASADHCTCEANAHGLQCWHRALLHILLVYNAVSVPIAPSANTVTPRKRTARERATVPAVNPWANASYEAVLAACDDLC